jgi:hypothetical protein
MTGIAAAPLRPNSPPPLTIILVRSFGRPDGQPRSFHEF